MEDDFTTPDGKLWNKGWNPDLDTDINDKQEIWRDVHDEFASKWLVHDKETPELGKSLFYHENGRSSNSYHRSSWTPEYHLYPEIPQNV